MQDRLSDTEQPPRRVLHRVIQNYYLGLIKDVHKIVCEKHIPELESKPEYAGTGLICSVCRAMKEDRLRTVRIDAKRLNSLPIRAPRL